MLLYEDHRPGTPVYCLAFAPDGSTLAGAGKDGTLVLRHANGRVQIPLEYDPNRPPIQAVAYLPDGQSLVIGGAFGWLQYRHGCTWVSSPVSEKPAPVTSLAVIDEHTVAVGIGDRVKGTPGSFELWDVANGQKRGEPFTEPNGVRAVAVCPERRLVAWATGHRKVNVWDILKRDPIPPFHLPKNCPAIALTPDGKQLAAAVDYGVKLYDIERRRERLELKGHKGQVAAVVFSPDGETVATGSWDCTVKLWDVASGRERATFKWDIGRVYCLAYAPDGLRLAAGGDVGKVVVWDME
jgi:WD40 repeat protein